MSYVRYEQEIPMGGTKFLVEMSRADSEVHPGGQHYTVHIRHILGSGDIKAEGCTREEIAEFGRAVMEAVAVVTTTVATPTATRESVP